MKPMPSESDLVTEAGAVPLVKLLSLLSVPYLLRNVGQVTTVVASIALGVAAIVASGNLVESSQASIQAALRGASQNADLRIRNGFSGIPDSIIEEVSAIEGVAAASGLVIDTAHITIGGSEYTLGVVAIDIFLDGPIHGNRKGELRAEIPDPLPFVTSLGAVAIEEKFAKTHGLQIGDSLAGSMSSGTIDFRISGFIQEAPDSDSFDSLVLMDLPAAQMVLGRAHKVDVIDVSVSPERDRNEVRRRLEAAFGDTATVVDLRKEDMELRSLTSNIRLILGVPSVMALVVGSLVIFHAIAAAVTRRKAQIDVLRVVGASRGSLVRLFAAEGMIIGLLGSGLGILLGIAAARLAISIVETTLDVLYIPLQGSQFEISLTYILLATALGTLITVASFLTPAVSAIRNLSGLSVSSPARERALVARRMGLAGVTLIPFGLALSHFQTGFGETLALMAMAGDAAALLGVSLTIPLGLFAVGSPLIKRLSRGTNALFELGWQGLLADPVRTGMVISAVVVGSAYVLITVGSIGSLRSNIVGWVEQSMQADLIVAGEGGSGFFPSTPPLPSNLRGLLDSIEGVEHVEPVAFATQPFRERWGVVVGRAPDAYQERFPLEVVEGDRDAGLEALEQGSGGWVSLHFANQHGVTVGDEIHLRSPTGTVDYKVHAIVNDYSSADLGTVFASLATLRSRWLQANPNAYHLWTAKGNGQQGLVSQAIAGLCACDVLTVEELKSNVANVVDSMFYSAYALEGIAAVVMLVAILCFFAMALDDRQAQLRTLRSIGATRSQLTRSLLWEAALIGLIGGVFGCMLGYPLAKHMAEVTMHLGGGFELDFMLRPEIIALTIVGAICICTVGVSAQIWRGALDTSSPARGRRQP